MTDKENKSDNKYYHKINNLELNLCEKSKHIMIYQRAKDFSYKYGIAGFYLDNDESYWYLRTYGNFNNKNVDWYDFGCLVDLGYKWIKELGWDD